MTQDSPDQFKLSLHGDGISIEKNVDRNTAAAVVSVVMGGPAISQMNSARFHGAVDNSSVAPQKSLREFLIDVSPATNIERITAIGLYLHKYKSKDTFSKEDIEAGFKKARETRPSNLSRDLSNSVKSGAIDEAAESGLYYVTNTGERSLTEYRGNASKAGRPKSKRTRKKSASNDSTEVESDKTKKRKKASVGDLRPWLDEWAEQGFFDHPQTIRSVMDRYHENAIIVKQTSLSGLMLRAVRDGLLSRSKIEDDGKSVWGYSKAAK